MRQLAAIFFSEIEGYARLVERDEDAALELLELHRRIMQDAIRRHEGTVIKTVGDSFMVTFASGVAAVECALDAQRAIELQNAMSGHAAAMPVKIGVHVGDVVLRDGDLFGDAVNVAARLKALSPSGGVAVSRTVYEQIRRKVRASIKDLGLVALKNIDEPVQVYALKPGPEPVQMENSMTGLAARPPPPAPPSPSPATKSRRSVMVLGGAAVAAAVAAPFLVRGLKGMGKPKPGGKLRYAIGEEIGSFKLFTGARSRSRLALRVVLDFLVDSGRDGDGVPGVLSHWDSAGAKLEFRLRPDVWFHDHPCFEGGRGRRAVAADVAFSLRQALLYASLPLPVEGASALRQDPAAALPGMESSESGEVLSVRITGPAPFFEAALQDVPLLPRELASQGEKILDLPQPPGTGPFCLSGPTVSSRIHLLRASRYWRPGFPLLEEVEIADGSDLNSSLAGLSAGEIDIYQPLGVDWPALFDLTGPRPRFKPAWNGIDAEIASASAHNRMGLCMLLVAPHTATLRDPLLRQAVAWAVDRQALVAASKEKLALPAGRFLEAGMLGFDPTLTAFAYDPSRARSLLRQAGHADGEGLAEILIGTYPSYSDMALLLVAQLQAVGIKVRMVPGDGTEISRMAAEGKTDATYCMGGFTTHGSEADDVFYALAATGAGTGRLEGLLGELTAAPDRNARAALYGRIEKAFLEDLPAIPTGLGSRGRPSNIFVLRRDVRGFHDPATGSAALENLRHTWLDR